MSHCFFLFRDKHREIRDGYDRLHRISAKGPNSKEFIEPKVQGLWKIAVESDFTADELESLRVSKEVKIKICIIFFLLFIFSEFNTSFLMSHLDIYTKNKF